MHTDIAFVIFYRQTIGILILTRRFKTNYSQIKGVYFYFIYLSTYKSLQFIQLIPTGTDVGV